MASITLETAGETTSALAALADFARPSPSGETRVLVVLPAYNEAENITPLLHQISCAAAREPFPFAIIVVDDGSTDETAHLVRSYNSPVPLTLVRHPKNEGLGTTLKDGLLEAVSQASGNDVIVTLDADGSQRPALIGRMVQAVLEGRDVVIASRFRPYAHVAGVPWHRRLCSRGASMLFRTLMPIQGVRDYTCGFRAYRAGALRRLVDRDGSNFIRARGFECMVELLASLRAEHLVFGEEPIVLRYDWKSGASKMQVWLTIRRLLALAVRQIPGMPGPRK